MPTETLTIVWWCYTSTIILLVPLKFPLHFSTPPSNTPTVVYCFVISVTSVLQNSLYMFIIGE